jgi:L-ascorbate metabolism protein UlaG (beta-lactamase superfamily)
MAVTVTWFNHASFRIASQTAVAYIDPWKLAGAPKDGNVVLVSHSHYDHLSPDDIAKVLGKGGQVFGPGDVAAKLNGCRTVAPGEQTQVGQIKVRGVPAYNVDKKFHPRANNWLGWIVELDGKRVYYAGDTDLIPEMGELGKISLALLPVGGTYTMDASSAAEAVGRIKPEHAVPYHWGDIVGQRPDAETFAKLAGQSAVILTPGQSLTLA